jgi:hypothetical protein
MPKIVAMLMAPLLLGAVGFAGPSLANDGVKIGNNNNVIMNGQLNGAQTALAMARDSNAQTGIASIMSGRGAAMGNNNNFILNGRVNGAQTALSMGRGANAQTGVASIMGGVR